MDRRMLLVVIIVAAAVVIGLIIYFLVFYDFGAKPTVVPVSQTPAASDQLPRVTNTQTAATSSQPGGPAADAGPVVQEDAAQVAKIFTERFGTWSNQSGAGQFDDLKFFTTAKMWSWLEANQSSIVKGADNYKEYYGMTTQAVASRLLNLQTGVAATVLVSAKRTESKGNSEPRVFNQDLKVELKKIGSRWQVDSASWQ